MQKYKRQQIHVTTSPQVASPEQATARRGPRRSGDQETREKKRADDNTNTTHKRKRKRKNVNNLVQVSSNKKIIDERDEIQ